MIAILGRSPCYALYPSLRYFLHWYILEDVFGIFFLNHSNYWIKFLIIPNLKIRILANLSRVLH